MAKYFVCTNCFGLKTKKIGKNIYCYTCKYELDYLKYKSLLEDARNALRFGYQYRVRYEEDYERNKDFSVRYCLTELNEFFQFIALAAISGIIGNYSYYKIKNLLNNTTVITLRDKELKKILRDESEQDKFIKYIQEYRDNKIKTPKKVIEAIEEEIEVDKRIKENAKSWFFKKVSKKNKSKKEELEIDRYLLKKWIKIIKSPFYKKLSTVSEEKKLEYEKEAFKELKEINSKLKKIKKKAEKKRKK